MINEYINQIIHDDCLEILKNIPDDSIDITFADPPFNLKKKYNGYKDNKDISGYLEWCKQWINEMVRITKPTGWKQHWKLPSYTKPTKIQKAKD